MTEAPPKDLVDAIVDMKRRNPRWGCPRIAQQIALAFAVDIDKDVVRRVLATHYRPAPRSGGPSWLTFLGHAKDSLWSIDLFRCESATLRSHWVLVVMDQYTRRIVGFGIHAGTVDGRALCRMFNHAIRGLSRPKRLSSDNDPLYRFHQWCANLRVLQVTEVKSVPYVPLSHPFVERLIGTLRRECVDQLLFWSASDLEDKLVAFQDFYNAHRAHASLDGRTPVPIRAVLQQHISRTPSRELRGWFRLPRHEDRAIDRILTNSPPTGPAARPPRRTLRTRRRPGGRPVDPSAPQTSGRTAGWPRGTRRREAPRMVRLIGRPLMRCFRHQVLVKRA